MKVKLRQNICIISLENTLACYFDNVQKVQEKQQERKQQSYILVSGAYPAYPSRKKVHQARLDNIKAIQICKALW